MQILEKTMVRTHTCGELGIKEDKKAVTLTGWAQRIRDHGGKKFIDLRDREGFTQVVFDPDVTKNFKDVEGFRREYLIEINGKVRPRPEGTVNKKVKTGEIEVIVESFSVVSECEVLPFELDEETYKDVNEEVRLEYRYLDLRRSEMFNTLKNRHKFIKVIRDIMDKNDFLEVDTPNLTKSTPEGSRDFLVPYRKKKGEFFALPQSPQMFKQMLMVAGVERYYQIASCFRDEDLRKDRQYEHKQIDMEVSFATRDELFAMTEEMFSEAFSKVYGVKLTTPFPRIEYWDAMEKYGSDKPDLRISLDELVDVSEIVKDSGFGVFANNVKNGGKVKGLRLPKGQELMTRKDIDKLIELAQRDFGAKGLAWMKVMDKEIESSITKFFKEDELKEIREAFNAESGDLLFFASDSKMNTFSILDNLRRYLAQNYDFIDEKKESFCFIVNFPLFAETDSEDSITFEHSPFSMPIAEDVDYLMGLKHSDIKKEREKLLSLGSEAYDLVYQGVELGSGALRIHLPALQRKIFELLGKSDEQIDEQFGWFMKAYSFSAPPHRGWGLGIDRIIMLAEGKPSIRDVIAFPRNKHGYDPLTQSPSGIDEGQLKELGLKLDVDKKKD